MISPEKVQLRAQHACIYSICLLCCLLHHVCCCFCAHLPFQSQSSASAMGGGAVFLFIRWATDILLILSRWPLCLLLFCHALLSVCFSISIYLCAMFFPHLCLFSPSVCLCLSLFQLSISLFIARPPTLTHSGSYRYL